MLAPIEEGERTGGGLGPRRPMRPRPRTARLRTTRRATRRVMPRQVQTARACTTPPLRATRTAKSVLACLSLQLMAAPSSSRWLPAATGRRTTCPARRCKRPASHVGGAPLAYPLGISVSFDGAQLFVADRAAGDDSCSSPTALPATTARARSSARAAREATSRCSRARKTTGPGVSPSRCAKGQPALYFTAFAPDQGAAGLFTVAIGGGVPQELASGDAFHEPGGVAAQPMAACTSSTSPTTKRV
jgi:hypothetical protein